MHNPWVNFETSPMGLCEEPINAWIRTPANTWSNLPMVIVGIFLLIIHRKRLKKMPLLRIIPIIAIIAGSLSFIYHASYTYELLVIDVMGTWLPISYVAVMNLDRLFGLKKRMFWLLFLSLFFLPAIPMMIFKSPIVPMLSVVFYIFMVLLEIPIKRTKGDIASYKYLFLMLVSQSFAAAFWLLDQKGIICNPQNHFIQGHTFWHVLNAVGFIFLYKHYELYFLKKDKNKGYNRSV